MKRAVWATALLALVGCSQQSGGSLASIVGAQDLVLVDERGVNGELADVTDDGVVVGTPNRYVFVTSVDTNELRVLNLYRPDLLGRRYLPAPNPLETLSIPVLDRPSILAVDEGLNARGRRVTGSYVYATRAGASAVSVVGADISELRVVTQRPIPTPAPVTAIAAWMGQDLAALPSQTSLFVSTFDGERGAVYQLKLATDPAALRAQVAEHPTLEPQRLFDVASESIAAMHVMPALTGRTVDGKAFCDVRPCLAIATRRSAGQAGRTLLIDPETLESVPLDFPGPVRDLATAGYGTRLFGILDEEKCGSSACGGVIGVDTVTATSPAGFPLLRDFSGAPVRPITVGGGALPMGLTLGQGGVIRETAESSDGGSVSLVFALREYTLLGAVSASNGEITFFDGIAGTVIDYDGRRPTIASASLSVPGQLEDGGTAYTGPDGGGLGTLTVGTVVEVPVGPETPTRPWRETDVYGPDGGSTSFHLDIADGYFQSQAFVAVYEGQLPGLVNLPTTQADGTRVTLPAGVEGRLQVGDRARFSVGDTFCGEGRVAVVAADHLEVDQVPPGCEGRTRCSIRASGAQPIIVANDFDGYLGRGGVGETVTYTKPYLTQPVGWSETRPALRMTLGDSLPMVTGAFWSFLLDSRLQTYRLAFDSTNVGCSSQLPGRLIMGQFPTLVEGKGQTFPWGLMGVLPSGNALVELNLGTAFRGAVGNGDGAFCYR